MKTSRNLLFVFEQALTVAPHGLNECFLTAVLKVSFAGQDLGAHF